jgi:hypothetical protein
LSVMVAARGVTSRTTCASVDEVIHSRLLDAPKTYSEYPVLVPVKGVQKFAGVAQWLEFQPSKHGMSFHRGSKLFGNPYTNWDFVVAGSSTKSQERGETHGENDQCGEIHGETF